jgi:hypothetical protein
MLAKTLSEMLEVLKGKKVGQLSEHDFTVLREHASKLSVFIDALQSQNIAERVVIKSDRFRELCMSASEWFIACADTLPQRVIDAEMITLVGALQHNVTVSILIGESAEARTSVEMLFKLLRGMSAKGHLKAYLVSEKARPLVGVFPSNFLWSLDLLAFRFKDVARIGSDAFLFQRMEVATYKLPDFAKESGSQAIRLMPAVANASEKLLEWRNAIERLDVLDEL